MSKHNIVHVEIPTRSRDESAKFYHDLFGWKVTAVPEFNYSTWEPLEPPGGGFAPVDEDYKIGEVLIHVASDDIEADLKKAKSLGATIVREKSEIPGIGWWGVFKDPAGNKIALYTDIRPSSAG